MRPCPKCGAALENQEATCHECGCGMAILEFVGIPQLDVGGDFEQTSPSSASTQSHVRRNHDEKHGVRNHECHLRRFSDCRVPGIHRIRIAVLFGVLERQSNASNTGCWMVSDVPCSVLAGDLCVVRSSGYMLGGTWRAVGWVPLLLGQLISMLIFNLS